MGGIFVSYRRHDSAAMTLIVVRELKKRYCTTKMFYDADPETRAQLLGANLPKVLVEKLRESTVALIVIGRDWLDQRDSSGRRRLDDPNDYVRLEVQTALRLSNEDGLVVVPLLVDGASMPLADSLPPDLVDLTRLGGWQIDLARTEFGIRVMSGLFQRLDQYFPVCRGRDTDTPVRITSREPQHQPTVAVGNTMSYLVTLLIAALVLYLLQTFHVLGGAQPGSKDALFSISATSPTQAWAVGDNGSIMHLSGGDWSKVPSPTKVHLNAVFMVSDRQGWAVGGDPGGTGTVLYFGGATWYMVPGVVSAPLCGLYMVSGSVGWAVGWDGVILRYLNGKWLPYGQSPTTQILRSVYMSSATEGWAVGDGGEILRYSGNHWMEARRPTVSDLYSVVEDSAGEGWAVGSRGTLLQLLGEEWIPRVGATTSTLSGVAMLPNGEDWAVGQYGSLEHYVSGDWQLVQSPTRASLFAVVALTYSQALAVGDHGTILRYVDEAWT